MVQLDAHEAPPEHLRKIFKHYKAINMLQLDSDPNILDFNKIDIRGLRSIPMENFTSTFDNFLTARGTVKYTEARKSAVNSSSHQNMIDSPLQGSVYESDDVPGLLVFPSLYPIEIQSELVKQIVSTELPIPQHKTNLHAHYDVEFPNLWETNPESIIALPKNPSSHKPLTLSQVMNKKLRWITLGGQYDWTNKVYPEEEPPKFPQEIGNLVEGLFPDMQPQAAIVNFYSPGDTLSLHRDVSEEVDHGLVSISIGCDCIFIVGLEKESITKSITLRLRSGDTLYMTGESRFAWHGVPKIIGGTSPPYLDKDASGETPFLMRNKRINLNVRQMRERKSLADS